MSVAVLADVVRALQDERGVAVSVRAEQQLSGGASMQTWALELDAGGTLLPAVLRCERPGREHRVDEPRLLQVAARAGVPVPAVLAHGSGWLLMERVEGQSIPRKILRDEQFAAARPLLARQCGAALAAVHSVPPAAVDFLGPARDSVALLAEQEDLLDALAEPSPAFELGLRWLRRHLPPAVAPTLVHGDYRNGNLIVGPSGLQAVIDWELAHVGDPREDLGWLCVRAWRFGNDEATAGGFGPVEELLAGYEQAGGTPPDPEALRFWIVCGTLRWGVMCMLQAAAHLTGAVRSVELATIGRRVAEQEYDLLELLAVA